MAFNYTVMEWVVVARLWLDKQTPKAYALAFRKIFDHYSQSSRSFEIGKTLLGVASYRLE